MESLAEFFISLALAVNELVTCHSVGENSKRIVG